MDRRRRAGRDHAALCALCRHHRTKVARGTWRPSAQARARRAALGKGPCAGDRARARHAIRPAGIRQPQGAVRTVRCQARARHLHPVGAGGGRLRYARPVFRSQPAPPRRYRAPRAQVAPSGHPGRRGLDPCLLRRADPRGDLERRRFRALAPRRRTRAAAAALSRARRPDATPGSGHHHGKFSACAAARAERLRHKLGALDEFAAAFCASVAPSDTPLAAALTRYIRSRLNLEVPSDAFRADSAPAHLQMNFRVVDHAGRQLAMSRNLAALKSELSPQTEAVLRQDVKSEKYSGWTMGDLAEVMEIERDGQVLVGYPALVDAGDAVTLQVVDAPEKARELHRVGVRRLLAIAFRERIRDLERRLGRDVVVGPLKDD